MARKPVTHFGSQPLVTPLEAAQALEDGRSTMTLEYKVPVTHDRVNHPEHYISDPSGIECIEITRHRNFNVGNAIKYLWRAGLKDSASHAGIGKHVEDLEKAIWYINDEIARLKKLDLTNS